MIAVLALFALTAPILVWALFGHRWRRVEHRGIWLIYECDDCGDGWYKRDAALHAPQPRGYSRQPESWLCPERMFWRETEE